MTLVLNSYKKIIITSGTKIYPYEFIGLDINEIILPDTITKISEHSFSDCKLLKEIKLPDSVVEIGAEVFDNCNSLRTIYAGSKLKTVGTNITSPQILEPDRGCGDIDNDGKTDLTDLLSLSLYLLQDYNFTTSAQVYSDITKDGEVDIADLASLKMLILDPQYK